MNYTSVTLKKNSPIDAKPATRVSAFHYHGSNVAVVHTVSTPPSSSHDNEPQTDWKSHHCSKHRPTHKLSLDFCHSKCKEEKGWRNTWIPMMAFLCMTSSCAIRDSKGWVLSLTRLSSWERAERMLGSWDWISFNVSGRMMERKLMLRSCQWNTSVWSSLTIKQEP